MSVIQECNNCGNTPHTQDQLHGKGKRVFITDKDGNPKKDGCTVCGRGRRKSTRMWAIGTVPAPFGCKVLDPHLRVENYPWIPKGNV